MEKKKIRNKPMLYFKITIGLLILYFLFVFLRLTYATRSGLASIKPNDTLVGQGPSLRYIAAGDSTAVGVGASAVEKTYTYKILDKLSQNHHVFYKNIAVSGSKTKNVIDKQLNEIILFNPDVVTLSIGANDLTHMVSSDQIILNYKKIISELSQKTKAKIYITDIPTLQNAKLLPWWYRKLLDQKANRLNEKIMAMETDRVRIVDIHNFGWAHYSDIQATFAKDHFHPSDLGYQNWTDAFLDKITKKQ